MKWLIWCKQHKTSVAAAVLLVGLIFLLLPGIENRETAAPNQPDLKAETEEYKAAVTEELTAMLSDIKGVGSVKLLLTFENSVEYQYLKEENENTDIHSEDQSRDYSESYLLVSDSGGKQGVLAVKRLLPKASGAAVVCAGGDDPVVCRQVTELLRAALGISAADISVLPLA